LALKALEIDSNTADAQRVLATLKMAYEWDFRGAEQDIRKAIREDPADLGWHILYADLLSALGRHEEALGEAKLMNLPTLLHPAAVSAVTRYTYYRARKMEAIPRCR